MARITEEEFKSIPHNPDTIRISDDFGGGYMASPEVYHQLHCLVGSMEMCYVFRINSIKNLLRMGSYWNWDYYRNSSKPNVGRITSRMHYGIDSPTIRFLRLLTCTTDHCIELLRQNLMCKADTTLVTFRWVEGVHEPFPNFSNWHRCRNWDSIVHWATSKRPIRPIPGKESLKFRPQPGDKVWPDFP